MRRPLAAALVAVLLVVALVRCTGEPTTAGPRALPSLDEGYTPSIDAQIRALFPTGELLNQALGRYGAIQRYNDSEASGKARELTNDFVAWTLGLEKQGALRDPNGPYEAPTTHQAVGTLVASLLGSVYPGRQPPVDLADRDGAVLVIGTGDDTLKAPSRHAAALFPAGALLPGTVVTLYKIAQTTPGAGPLPTGFQQYGPFYQIEVFPDQRMQRDGLVAICQVTDQSSPFYPPEEVHERLQLAKPDHDNPTVLELLPKADPSLGGLIVCADVVPGFAAVDAPHGRLDAARLLAVRVGGQALSLFTPTPAYAIHLGLGGRTVSGDGFSPFGAVDPGNTAPVARVGGPYTGRREGTVATYDGSTSSDADGDALAYAWNFGDGTPEQSGAKPTHTYADNGTYTVTLTVSDGKGGSSTSQTSVVVANAAPEIRTIVLDYPALNAPRAGSTWSMIIRWRDIGLADAPWSYRVDFGDGAAAVGTRADQSEIPVSHVYATPGSRTLTMRITDKDGASATRSIPVNVQP